jgi:PPM family protein phosphatase
MIMNLLSISGFTHVGTLRQINQDRLLIQENIYKEGFYSFERESNCLCFIADGIGGGPAGEFAAQYVLEQTREKIKIELNYSEEDLLKIFSDINAELLEVELNNSLYLGSGTTLVGLIIKNENFFIINAGDSQAWILRDDNFFKVTEDQVLESPQVNSPLISYFGGKQNELHLVFSTVLRNLKKEDIFLLCSDGLFKSIESNQVKAILSNSKPLKDKAQFILQKTLAVGAEDNISCILVEIIS